MWTNPNILKTPFLESLPHAWRIETLTPICSLLTFLVHLLKLHSGGEINGDEASRASWVQNAFLGIVSVTVLRRRLEENQGRGEI